MKLVNLIPLKEIDFSSQKAFDKYNKVHKLRPNTKVNIAGKTTTAGQASKVKGASVFGGDKKPSSADLERSKKISTSLAKRDKDNYDNTTRMISLARAGKIGPAKSNSNKIEPIIKNIADLTDRNDHNGAIMALAKMTGDKTYIEQMQKIQRYHELKGHMPQSLIKYRTAIMNNLLMQAKNQYGDKVAKQLHNAF